MKTQCPSPLDDGAICLSKKIKIQMVWTRSIISDYCYFQHPISAFGILQPVVITAETNPNPLQLNSYDLNYLVKTADDYRFLIETNPVAEITGFSLGDDVAPYRRMALAIVEKKSETLEFCSNISSPLIAFHHLVSFYHSTLRSGLNSSFGPLVAESFDHFLRNGNPHIASPLLANTYFQYFNGSIHSNRNINSLFAQDLSDLLIFSSIKALDIEIHNLEFANGNRSMYRKVLENNFLLYYWTGAQRDSIVEFSHQIAQSSPFGSNIIFERFGLSHSEQMQWLSLQLVDPFLKSVFADLNSRIQSVGNNTLDYCNIARIVSQFCHVKMPDKNDLTRANMYHSYCKSLEKVDSNHREEIATFVLASKVALIAADILSPNPELNPYLMSSIRDLLVSLDEYAWEVFAEVERLIPTALLKVQTGDLVGIDLNDPWVIDHMAVDIVKQCISENGLNWERDKQERFGVIASIITSSFDKMFGQQISEPVATQLSSMILSIPSNTSKKGTVEN